MVFLRNTFLCLLTDSSRKLHGDLCYLLYHATTQSDSGTWTLVGSGDLTNIWMARRKKRTLNSYSCYGNYSQTCSWVNPLKCKLLQCKMAQRSQTKIRGGGPPLLLPQSPLSHPRLLISQVTDNKPCSVTVSHVWFSFFCDGHIGSTRLIKHLFIRPTASSY